MQQQYEDAIGEIDQELKKLDMMQEGQGEMFGTSPQTRFSDRIEPPPVFSTPYRPQPEGESKIEEKLSESISRIEGILDRGQKKKQQEIDDMDKELEQIEAYEQNLEKEKEKQKKDSKAFSGEIDRKELQLQELQDVQNAKKEGEEKTLRQREEQKKAYAALDAELKRKKKINTELQTVITNLENLY
jgi:DNA repair exonuclease SbcCD ATPase subunit